MNLYAYTKQEFLDLALHYGGLMVKVGCSVRPPETRIDEQQGTSDATAPIVIGEWFNVPYDDDREVHSILDSRGMRSNKLNGAGTEWFLLTGIYDIIGANAYLNSIVGFHSVKEKKMGIFKRVFEAIGEMIFAGKVMDGDASSIEYLKQSKGYKIRK